ncbi:hypothetical protein IW261DRAFT_1625481 [Armillaria novae-zelandiae]|uniref:Uncharacterized protein n=1 Tax=Armillaria novae-zelandiae TaxID=153914 RepID=A0AA39P8Z1_9AGAR|nr:hypothetical protein IW261DRAFT_1625481 [Armillaria novae-zelandiae]
MSYQGVRFPLLDLENYNRDLSNDPLRGFDLFGTTPPDIMPVIEVIEDIESVKQINDPWNFFHELDTLKRIEADYQERMKVTVQADIDRAQEKDEALCTQLQSKMPKRRHECSPEEMIAMSVTEGQNEVAARITVLNVNTFHSFAEPSGCQDVKMA